jgi:myosin I
MPIHSSLTSRKQAGISDAVLLEGSEGKDKSIVSEKTFIENLETRFKQDIIYTYIGSVLISVNPFKPLDGMYGKETVDMYRNRKLHEVPPHVFALTDAAYR